MERNRFGANEASVIIAFPLTPATFQTFAENRSFVMDFGGGKRLNDYVAQRQLDNGQLRPVQVGESQSLSFAFESAWSCCERGK